MRYRIFQIDAFTETRFHGNPAAVCILDKWPYDTVLQNIAKEMNLAETAFLVPHDDGYDIRWFTPTAEIDLCGHATLASAYVLYEYYFHSWRYIQFFTKTNGTLTVEHNNDWLAMNFPVDTPIACAMPKELEGVFSTQPKEIYHGATDYMLVFESEEEIRRATPKLEQLKKLNCRGVVITAQGTEHDFVSRFFAPQIGIAEDPVTGSTHTLLCPYWSKQLNKHILKAEQLSERGGTLLCRQHNQRVIIEGKAVAVLEGEIEF